MDDNLAHDIWDILHCGAMLSKKGNNEECYRFLEKGLIVLLPCDHCRDHYGKVIKSSEYTKLSDPIECINYVHNQVNLANKKPAFSLNASMARYTKYINDKELLKNILSRVVLRLTLYWNNTYWKRGLNINKTKHLRRIVTHMMRLLEEKEPDVSVWGMKKKAKTKGDFYEYDKMSNVLVAYGIEVNKKVTREIIKRSANNPTVVKARTGGGCGCRRRKT